MSSSFVMVNNSGLGSSLQDLLTAQDIVPGDEPSYQLCKTIYLYHPLGAKMAESPVSFAQSQEREISIQRGPEDRLKEAFTDEWRAIGADSHIHNVAKTSRIYGVASLGVMIDGEKTSEPLNLKKIAGKELRFNVFDPLNTAGSLVLSQDPNSSDFQKSTAIAVQGQSYHPSRTVVAMNEKPIFIGYTNSAFGYVGRSVYQRALFPLKSFVQSMITDDMVVRKSGVIVAKLKPAGSIVNNIMTWATGIKRELIKEAETNNVISINAPDEDIQTLNMQNLDGAYELARKNILENIAVSADMPAKMLNSETFAEGFGEGTEDAKAVAHYIDRVRLNMSPLYEFFDAIVQRRAWSEDFFEVMRHEYPEEYGKKTYAAAFYEWRNSFRTAWPSLLTEPDSKKAEVDKIKLDAIVQVLDKLLPQCDPENKALLLAWAQDNLNENKMMFTSPLELDLDTLARYAPQTADEGAELNIPDDEKIARLRP